MAGLIFSFPRFEFFSPILAPIITLVASFITLIAFIVDIALLAFVRHQVGELGIPKGGIDTFAGTGKYTFFHASSDLIFNVLYSFLVHICIFDTSHCLNGRAFLRSGARRLSQLQQVKFQQRRVCSAFVFEQIPQMMITKVLSIP